MPLMFILRLFASMFSWTILVIGGYLLWRWYQGDWVRDVNGVLHREREGWPL
jgi:hypothetical protein